MLLYVASVMYNDKVLHGTVLICMIKVLVSRKAYKIRAASQNMSDWASL